MNAVLMVTGLTVSASGFDIIREVTCQAHSGQILAILGPNGAGKTTLLKAILGLLPVSAGQVLVHGQTLSTAQTRAKVMAYVPQHSQLAAQLSAREVVELGRFPHRGARLGLGADDQRVVNEALALTDCAYLQQRRFATCSGGEQARLLIARALATEAEVLLLDEPAASLDIAHRLHLYALLRRLSQQGKTVVLVMHQLEDALAWADAAVLLAQGQVVASGAAQDVLSPERVRQIYGVEMLPGAAMGFRLVNVKSEDS